MMRSVPICLTEVTRRDLRNLRSLVTKGDGAVAVVLEYFVVWQRKPESRTSCLRWSGLESLTRKILWICVVSVWFFTDRGEDKVEDVVQCNVQMKGRRCWKYAG